jgi:hypothetical protein
MTACRVSYLWAQGRRLRKGLYGAVTGPFAYKGLLIFPDLPLWSRYVRADKLTCIL